MSDETSNFTGLSDAEAKEFQRLYVMGFIGFTAIAVVAHILAWMWRPWLPGEKGYTSALESIDTVVQAVSMLS